MKTLILACNTIRDELEKTASETGCTYPFRWVESGLHLRPESLRQRLQLELDSITGMDRVILGFGFCGNALVGLKSKDYELIIPRADDCITLLLGSRKNRECFSRTGAMYFLTRGWLQDEFNIWKEYQSVLARFGAEKTQRIYERMLGHYRFLALIDTGAYELEALLPLVREIASTLKLEIRVLPGSDGYLKKLLSAEWNADEFITVPPHTQIELFHLNPDLFADTCQVQSA